VEVNLANNPARVFDLPKRNDVPQVIFAYLHPPIRKVGVAYTGRYSVTFDGETLVEGSRDPETDALLDKGIVGTVMVLDVITGTHRTTVNIEAAAKLRTEAGPYGPRFVRFRETVVGRPHTGEDDLVVPTMPGDDDKAVA
jgi:hypothetical protein